MFEAIRKDDHQAFDVLYQRYGRQLYLFMLNKVRKAEAAEELVNDVFLILWEKRDSIKISTNAAAYIFTIAKNLTLQYIRSSHNKQQFIEEIAAIEIPASAAADDAIYYQELTSSLTAIINELPEKCREIFLLSRDKEKSSREIADELKLSDQTVKNQLSKALRVLRYKLNEATHFLFNFMILILSILNEG